MLFSLSVVPVGAGESMVEPVAQVVKKIEDAGLDFRLNGMSTVIEGEWDEVLPVIREAHRAVKKGSERVFMVLTVDDHNGVANRLDEAVEDVEERLGHSLPH